MLQILSFMTERNWFQRGKYNKNKKSQKKICNSEKKEYNVKAFSKSFCKWVISSAGRAAPF